MFSYSLFVVCCLYVTFLLPPERAPKVLAPSLLYFLVGISSGNIATECLYDNDGVRRIMERHRMLMKEFREQEFTKKLEMASKTRFKGFKD